MAGNEPRWRSFSFGFSYSASANSVAPYTIKFNGFGKFTRSRNYIANSSGIFAVVQTDDTLASLPLRGIGSTREAWYIHADQLGSILRVTDQDGRVRERFWYDPWGARTEKLDDHPGPGKSQTLQDSWKRGFTGHEHLGTFALIHMNGRVYSTALSNFLSVDPINQTMADTQGGGGYSYARNNPLRYVDPTGKNWGGWVADQWEGGKKAVGGAGTAIWHGVTHFGGEVGKWFSENWRTVVVIAVVVVVTYLTVGTGTPEAMTLGESILVGAEAGAATGAAAGFVGAALYGGNLEDDLQAAVKGAVIGAFTGAAFAGVGHAFTPQAGQALSTTSRIEWTAAHGVVGGAKSVMEGGNFWKGFVAAAATKATSFGPNFDNYTANVTRAAVAGGTAAVIAGDKFENGAVTGAFSYAFNDWLHRPPPPEDRIDPDYTIENLAGAATGVYALARAGFSLAAGWWMSEGAVEGAAELVTVTHFTSAEGVAAIEGGALRAGSFVALPGEVSGLTAMEVESALEIQAGRGAFSYTFQTPSSNLVTPLNGPFTSGLRTQFQLVNTVRVAPGSFVRTPVGP